MPIPHGYSRFKMGGLACLYKGSDRGPTDVFANGWPTKVGDIDIGNHLLNGGIGSCWWSTSLDPVASKVFGRYIYRIIGLNNEAIVANEAYCIVKKKDASAIPFREQAEMSVYSRIPAVNVAGCFDTNNKNLYAPNPSAQVAGNTATWLWD